MHSEIRIFCVSECVLFISALPLGHVSQVPPLSSHAITPTLHIPERSSIIFEDFPPHPVKQGLLRVLPSLAQSFISSAGVNNHPTPLTHSPVILHISNQPQRPDEHAPAVSAPEHPQMTSEKQNDNQLQWAPVLQRIVSPQQQQEPSWPHAPAKSAAETLSALAETMARLVQQGNEQNCDADPINQQHSSAADGYEKPDTQRPTRRGQYQLVHVRQEIQHWNNSNHHSGHYQQDPEDLTMEYAALEQYDDRHHYQIGPRIKANHHSPIKPISFTSLSKLPRWVQRLAKINVDMYTQEEINFKRALYYAARTQEL